MMQVKVVGCGDAFGSGGRGSSCYLVRAAGRTVTLDFGASALVNFNRFALPSADIDTIFLSHLHGDHFAGIPFLLLDGQFVRRREKPLVVVGPPAPVRASMWRWRCCSPAWARTGGGSNGGWRRWSPAPPRATAPSP
ncbi:MBL fold metallo-hydrolase [Xanthobacter dioxanivorans]|uniref:MBL fold metallo-hydrolase n=1 Tax=Xanthobacter dioxanivorans TaxID=2528964 RepID=A0A974PPT6_9HYPH|nr:MBL fold metallo-hydrolase [Xanthobacter dioxanivorans]QRG07532.1 MBL fold metallo-hydrolase [Xanthobacter dioxanivorans]